MVIFRLFGDIQQDSFICAAVQFHSESFSYSFVVGFGIPDLMNGFSAYLTQLSTLLLEIVIVSIVCLIIGSTDPDLIYSKPKIYEHRGWSFAI